MSRPSAKKEKRSLARPFVVTMAVGIPATLTTLAAIGAGCGSSKPDAAGIGGNGSSSGGGDDSCSTEGAQRACHLNLGVSGSFQQCFQGTQTCTSGFWSPCGGSGMITSSFAGGGVGIASANVGGSNGGGIHTMSHKSSAVCGDGTCQPTETCSTCPADCGACPVGPGDALAPSCATDPCTPDCFGWNGTPAGITPGVATSGINVIGFGQINNGMLQKLALDSCTGSNDCDRWDLWGTRSSYANCQMDTFCSLKARGGTGCCEQFDDPLLGTYLLHAPPGPATGGSIGQTGVAARPDLTIGPGCSDRESDKYRYFPVCNRGTAPVPINTRIWALYTNPNPGSFPLDSHTAASCTPATADCSVLLDPLIFDGTLKPVPGGNAILGLIDPVLGLLPGQGVLMDTQAATNGPGGGSCSQPNGNKWIMINCDNGVNEGVLDPTLANTVPPIASPLQPTTPAGAIDGRANNWTDHSPDNNPPPCTGAKDAIFQIQYHAKACPVGTEVVWNKLQYHTKTPKSTVKGVDVFSEIFFEAQTAPETPDGGVPPASAFTPFVTMAEAKYNAYEGNNGTLTTTLPNCGGSPGCCAAGSNANQCMSDPENCTFVNPAAAGTYKWFTNTNGPAASPTPSTDTNPSTCPKDFEDQFMRPVTNTPFAGLDPLPGKKAARGPWLNLKMTLRGTPDGSKTPTLVDWGISYQCVAIE